MRTSTGSTACKAMERITSRQNPLMTRVRKITSSRSFRRREGEFLCDGVKLLEEALKWHAPLSVVIGSEGVRLPDLPEGVRRVEVPEDVMKSISPMEAPQGVLMLCRMPEFALPDPLEGTRYLVLDGVQDPGNVGTIWRTADAFGADGLILLGGCADPFNPKTVRAAMGAAFRLPVWEAGPDTLMERLGEAGIPLYATALRDDTVELGRISLDRCAVVIGSEGKGVSEFVLEQCMQTIKIPMEHTCESLNAAMAAGVVLWEMYREQTSSP